MFPRPKSVVPYLFNMRILNSRTVQYLRVERLKQKLLSQHTNQPVSLTPISSLLLWGEQPVNRQKPDSNP
jgi:hypothetical protein